MVKLAAHLAALVAVKVQGTIFFVLQLKRYSRQILFFCFSLFPQAKDQLSLVRMEVGGLNLALASTKT